MRMHKIRWLLLVGMILVGTAVWAVVPLAFGSGSTAQQVVTCQLQPGQPPMPLEMNTVVQQDLAKTIAQEKEVYVCRNDQGQITSVSDLETFVELVEQDTGTGVRPVARRVETALCRKDFVAGTVGCATKTIALHTPIPNPLVGCQQSPAQILDPVEMNSVVLPHFVKTIKVEKELFQCRPSPTTAAAGELFLFTEIIEARPATAATLVPVTKRFDAVFCLKDTTQPVVTGCTRVTIGNTP